MITRVRLAIFLLCCGACCVADHRVRAESLTPSTIYANAFHVTVLNGNDATLGDVQAGASLRRRTASSITELAMDRSTVLTRGKHDNTGAVTDFVGLGYASPATFDVVTVELGNQFVDGGDWETVPSVYILKNPVMRTRSRYDLNGVQTGSKYLPHSPPAIVFDPLVTQGPGGTVSFAVGGSVADRTGWGWAVGGVDGNQRSDGTFNFISVTELYAEGTPAAAPAIPKSPQCLGR